MTYQVKLFAAARQLVGAEEIEVSLATGATVAELRAAVAGQYPELRVLLSSALIAVNAQYANDIQELPASAEIAIIPPVSGG